MERIPEKELMDDVVQAGAYADADFSEAHDAFVAHFAARFPGFSSGRVLDLGCGACDVIIRFARAFPETYIIGVDGAQAMLDIGLLNVQEQNLSHRITLQKCKIPDSRHCKIKFSAVISNSLLHHLSDPAVMWQYAKECSKQEAPVFVMDLLRPDSKEKAKELVRRYTADASSVVQEDFFNSLLAAYSPGEIRQQLMEAGLDYLSSEIVSDRHILVWGTIR